MKRILLIILGVGLLVVGLTLTFKPTIIKDFTQTKENNKKVEDYQAKHKAKSDKKDSKKETKTPEIPKDKSKIAGILEIPSADIKEPVYPGRATPEQLDKGVSFAEKDESMDDQNIAIAGHTSNIQKSFQFTNLDEAKKGDKVHLTVDNVKQTYKMVDIRNVKPSDGKVMDDKKGEKDQLTLITCDNYNENTGEWEDRQIFIAEKA